MSSIPIHLFEPVLTTAAMREADRGAIEELGLPGRLLMENAGRTTADVLERELGPATGKRILILCGKGNNGGDGLVIARAIHARGAAVRAVILADESELTPDAATNLALLREIAAAECRIEISLVDAPNQLDPYWPDWVIDAMLGVGASGPLRDPIGSFARFANASPATTIAVDVATGVDSDTGEAADGAVRADLTVTMAAIKAGLLWREGPAHAGTIRCVEIGIPRHRLDRAVRLGAGWRSTDAAVRAMLPPRSHGAHKYSAGRVFVVAGSRAFPGAAVMTAQAAARSGAGAVVVATPLCTRDFLEARLTEVMTIGLPQTADGTIASEALNLLIERGNDADVVVIGPGLDRHPETQEVVRKLLARLGVPAVIDADGLNSLADHPEILESEIRRPWLLTPHLGEMRRLAGDADLDEKRPYEVAREWAHRTGCSLLLKGAPSVSADPEGQVVISGATTSALATAGTGDVLAGVAGALIAQGLRPTAASVVALHLTGRAAQRYTTGHAERTMQATDVIDQLRFVFPS